ncbi:MAG: hypothetical protein KG003_15840 [Bacteroidetes bacterium]|nr:hypothetical protein [Bacteroidota bacterium]
MRLSGFIGIFSMYFYTTLCFGNDTSEYYLQVHFLYGSKPSKALKDLEPKWFGGIHGGHVGLGLDSNKILNFMPSGKIKIFGTKSGDHGVFIVDNLKEFRESVGGETDSNHWVTFLIPITLKQARVFDSIFNEYLKVTPYDYAFFGMRCGAAAYDVAAKCGIVKEYSYSGTWIRIFYPKIWRRKLFKMAKKNNWQIQSHSGTPRRVWEKD